MISQKKSGKRWLALLVVLTLVLNGFPSIKQNGAVNAASNDAMTVTVSDFKIKGQSAENVSEVKDGDEIAFQLDWTLVNTDNEQKEFTIDLNEYLLNIRLNDTSGSFDNGEHIPMGTYEIKGNILTITLEDDFVTQTGRSGGFNIKGVISTDLDEDNAGDNVDVGFDGTIHHVTYASDVNEGIAYVTKEASTPWKNQDGQLQATYTVTIGADWNSGRVRNLELTDNPGSGLSDIGNITVTEHSYGLELADTYGSLEELNAALANIVLKAGQYIVVTYTMNVDEDIAEDSPTKNYDNEITLNYDKLRETSVDVPPTDSATVTYTPPSVTKTGSSVSKDGTEATWIIDVYLNSMYQAGSSLDDYVESIEDEPIEGIELPGEGDLSDGILDNLGDAQDLGNGHYRFTVTTPITEEYQNSVSQRKLKNKVTVDFYDDEPIEAEADNIYSNGRNWLTKAVESYDLDFNTITWKITLDNVPSDLTSLTLTDMPLVWGSNGDHTLEETNISIAVDGGEPTLVVENGSIVSYDILEDYNNGTLTFLKDWYTSTDVVGKDVEILLETQIVDNELRNKQYYNNARLEWTENEVSDSSEDSATWELPNAVSKTGKAVEGKNSIQYQVALNINDMGIIEEGETISITDTLPDKLEVEPENVFVYLKDGKEEWNTIQMDLTDESFVDFNGKKMTAYFITSPELLEEIEYIQERGWNNVPYIIFEYTADMDAYEAIDFTLNGEKETFTNSVVAEYAGREIGSNFDETDLTPQNVVEKMALYTDNTAPYVYYTITVNPSGLELSNSNLTAVDSLGSLLVYDLGSITVETEKGEILPEDAYDYTYDEETNSITFELPDATPLTIKYRARVNVEYDDENPDELTEENSYNEFSLSGFESDTTKAKTYFNQAVIKPNAWGSSTTGSVTLRKFWMDDGQMKALPGAQFEIYETEYDAATNSLKKVGATPSYANIVIGEDGTYEVKGLLFDHVYALYETKAPEGFVRNEEPYYFVIPASDFDKVIIPNNVVVNEFGNGMTLLYENKVDETAGKLIITKTIKGPVTKEEAEAALKFKVTNTATGASTQYTLVDFNYDAATGKYTLTLPKTAGTYTVEETATDIYGYVTESVKYSVNGGGQITGKSVNAALSNAGTVKVDFEDAYAKITETTNGQLVITKTIKGPVTREEVEEALEFEVMNSSEDTIDIYTLDDFTYDEDTDKYTLILEKPAETYTIIESAIDIDGYETVSVEYSVNGGKKKKGEEATVSLKAGKKVKIAFQDSYTEEEGEGEKGKTNSEFPKTGDSRGFMGMICIHIAILSTAGLVVVNRRKKKKA